ITREFSEDQHLDILIGIDAGRFSRVRVGRLDRFGLYANLAARFAEVVTHHDDRIGLMVYADRVLASCAPTRGLSGVMRRRRARGPGRGPAPPAAAGPRPGGGGAGGAARAGGVRALRGAAPKAARGAVRRGIRPSHASRRRTACSSMPRSGTA